MRKEETESVLTRLTRCFLSAAAVSLLALTSQATAQSGGIFEIKDANIGGGAASSSANGFELDGSVGQPAAGGALVGQPFGLTSGFWTFTPLAPTAAQASVSGRVVTDSGQPIASSVLYLQTQAGEIFVSRSSPFGYYLFEGITAGQSVFITVEHKRFSFKPRAVMVTDSITDLDFIGLPTTADQ